MRLIDAWLAYRVCKKMRKATITRFESGPLGTYGKMVTDNGYQCYSAELQWLDNKPNISCIPTATYLCEIVDSPKFGRVYEVKDVPGRKNILAHKGNFSASEGYGKSDIEGCILLGNAISEIAGQKALLSSKDAVARFMADMESEPFELTIAWGLHG